jgi:hypothetical protein
VTIRAFLENMSDVHTPCTNEGTEFPNRRGDAIVLSADGSRARFGRENDKAIPRA